MNEEIRQLTELQVIDLEIAKLEEESGLEQEALDKLQAIHDERLASIEDLKRQIADLEGRQRELEAESTDELARLKERQAKMMQVQTNREYQSILKEIEEGKRRGKERENDIVDLLAKREGLAALLAEQEEICEKEAKTLAEEKKAVAAKTAKLEKEKAGILKSREEKAANVKAPVLRKYDMLRTRRNGRAVVGVINGICQGCFMSIPPQLFNDILRGDRMLNCPTCQRILYHQAEAAGE